jgi:hypothetical protein
MTLGWLLWVRFGSSEGRSDLAKSTKDIMEWNALGLHTHKRYYKFDSFSSSPTPPLRSPALEVKPLGSSSHPQYPHHVEPWATWTSTTVRIGIARIYYQYTILSHGGMWYEQTYGTGMNKTLRHPRRVFPQSMPRLLNSGLAARGIPAPIIDLKKSLEARTEAAYWG